MTDDVSELWKMDVSEMTAALEAGEVTSVQLVTSSLARIEELNPVLNAFVFVDAERALAAAAESDERRAAGEALGPLDGIPFGVKDNIYVEGMPGSWGSLRFNGYVPDRHDIPVERLVQAGAVVVGLTNTPEMASASNTDNLVYGVTRNPHDVSLTPGGSSGGSTAAMVSGMVPFALGTDAGGSIRSPASITGLYGLRATNGRVPRAYGYPPMHFDRQAIGLLGRTLEDLEAVYEVTSGQDDRDAISQLVPPSAPEDAGRVGWFTHYGPSLVDDVVVERVTEAAQRLGEHGYKTTQVEPPYDMAGMNKVMAVTRPAGIAAALGHALHPDEPLTEGVARTLAQAEGITGAQYAQAMMDVIVERRKVSMAWGDMDVLLLPTTATAAWRAESPNAELIAGQAVDASASGYFTSWVNFVGYPGLSVPVTPYPDGRPIGIQVVARPGQELALFRIARALREIFLVSTAAITPVVPA